MGKPRDWASYLAGRVQLGAASCALPQVPPQPPLVGADRRRTCLRHITAAKATAAYVFRARQGLGLIGVRDEARRDKEAATALRQLKVPGVSTIMLTGDNPQTAGPLRAVRGWRSGPT